MLINKRLLHFFGEDAEALIYASAAKIGLPREEVDRSFPYGTYFRPESFITLWPFWLVRWLFNRMPVYQPLTAQGFAELMVNIQDAALASTPAGSPVSQG